MKYSTPVSFLVLMGARSNTGEMVPGCLVRRSGLKMHQWHHMVPCLLQTVVLAPKLLSRMGCTGTSLLPFLS